MTPPIDKTRNVALFMGLTFIAVTIALFAFIKRPPPRGPSDPDIKTAAGDTVNYKKSPEWSDAIPSLYQATLLSPKEGVALLLQSAVHVRTYVATELQTAGNVDESIAHAKLGTPQLETAITRQITGVVDRRMDSRRSITSVDYPMPRQPYPFVAIIALRSNTEAYASLIFELSPGSGYTAEQVKNKYGAPHDTTVDNNSFRLLTYPTETGDYFAKIVFQVGPGNEEVRQVTVTMQRRVK